MSSRHRKGVLALGVLLACALLTPPAQATYHHNKIREISYSNAGQDTAYIELQSYAAGENLVSGHNLTFWDADGLVLGSPTPVQTLPLTGPNPSNGQNQRTILIGDTGVPNRDFTLDLTPFFYPTGGTNNLVNAGAVCYEGIPVDCFSWGGDAFTGAQNLPDKATPYPGTLVSAQALKRRITKGCATLLEAGDDTNNNANDFTFVTQRDPTPNSATPVEKDCKSGLKPPPGSNFKCQGKPATLVGTDGKDDIKGTRKTDVIVAFGGNDKVNGRGGNDVLCGNGGRDSLKGGKGKDVLAGGAGADKLRGGASSDKLLGQAGPDFCSGGPGSDVEASCGGAPAPSSSKPTY